MANPACAACSKPVYPVEKVTAVDAAWHKACFKCTECNMTLNLKNFKGHQGKPYCGVHVPKAKASAVAETVDTRRVAAAPKKTLAQGAQKDVSTTVGGAGAPAPVKAAKPTGPRAGAGKTVGPSAGAGEKCRSCNKTVYPVEKLSACGTVWHKMCFKCQECGLTLNLKNHKAHQGVPYCDAHVPKAKSTAVADDVNTKRAMGAPKKTTQTGVSIAPTKAGQAPAPGSYNTGNEDQSTSTAYDEPAAEEPAAEPEPAYEEPAPEPEPEPAYEEPAPEPEPEPEPTYEEPAPEPEPEPVAEEAPAEEAPPADSQPQCRAIYQYDAEGEDELGFAEGDVINITEFIDDGWWMGEIDGRTGMFPTSYVERI